LYWALGFGLDIGIGSGLVEVLVMVNGNDWTFMRAMNGQ